MATGETGQSEEALKAFDKLTQLQPDEAVNYIGKGQCLMGLNRNDEALKALDKATTMNPKLADAWGIKGYLQAKMKKYDEAITSCNNAIEVSSPEHAGYRVYSRACVYALKGDKTNALADLKKAIAVRPDFKTRAPKDEDFKSLYSDPDFKKLTE
jgi:tetratricopeptide (TPR) repeat protein